MYLVVSGGEFSIFNDFLQCMTPIGIGMVLLIVICQFLYSSLSMLAAGEMC